MGKNMSDDGKVDKLDMIYDLLKTDRDEASNFRTEVRTAHVSTNEKLTKIETETTERLVKIEATNEIQNDQLKTHMRRCDLLEDLHKDNQNRIVILEEPAKIAKTMRDRLIIAGKVAGALMAIVGASAYFFGFLK